MFIKQYHYREFWDAPQHWEVKSFALEQVNLMVGRNSSGKSRVINTIGSLANFLSRSSINTWNSGHWQIVFNANGSDVELTLCIERGSVSFEEVKVDGMVKLSRNQDGTGKIWFSRIEQHVEIMVSPDTVAMVARRDGLQHPFLEEIYDWASALRMYQFSTDLGRQTVSLHNDAAANPESAEALSTMQALKDQNAVVEQYKLGWQAFGEEFDKAILRDMAKIGYDLSDIQARFVENTAFIGGSYPIMLEVQENDLASPTKQFEMSTGMFRALAMIIHMNIAIMRLAKSTILIDDIGEGLDFERSKSLVNLLVAQCADTQIQLIMTSNDRFVMNEVPLNHWQILERTGHVVQVANKKNSPDQFEQFALAGLSNFDFFSMKAYRGKALPQ